MLPVTSNPTHMAEATSLTPEPYVELFKFIPNFNTPDQFMAFTNHPIITWQGISYENFPHDFNGYNIQSTGEQSRPKLQIANPNSVFSSLILSGSLRQAQLIRYLVLRKDLLEDNNIFLRNKWLVSKVMNITRDTVSFELRSVLDGVRYNLPARQYISPEFPATSMG